MQELLDVHGGFIERIIRGVTVPKWVDPKDLRQEATIGFLDAIRRFNLERKNRFLTYAAWRIYKSIMDHLSETAYAAKVPFPDVIKLKTVLNRIDRGDGEGLDADKDFSQLNKNVHIQSLVSGHLSISPCGPVKDDRDDMRRLERGLTVFGMGDGVLGEIMHEEIMLKLQEFSVYEGMLLCQYLGIYVCDRPNAIKYIAGEKTAMSSRDTLVFDGAFNGFGMQLGETYNTCSKVIRQSQGRLREIVREYLDEVCIDYLEIKPCT
jgi:hypothetical protein